MRIAEITFTTSSVNIQGCPNTGLPEFAFIGRSNVGKSSLINLLAGIKSIAKISGTPGKTRTINHFLVRSAIDDTHPTPHTEFNWYLVDLPGYGYARLSKSERDHLDKMIRSYLSGRKTLVCTFLLIDVRLEPQRNDLSFIQWMGEKGIPFHIVFTKSDKLSAIQLRHSMERYRTSLSATWEILPLMITSSAEKKVGKEQILQETERILQSLRTPD